MTALSLNGIKLTLGGNDILCGADLVVQPGERVALVGPNGAGKSSLLRIVTGEWQADAGERTVQKGTRIGYIAQHPLLPEHTVWAEARSVFAHADALETRLLSLRQQLGATSQDAELASIARAIDETEHAFADAGGYAIDAQVRRVLHGLSFPEPLHALQVSALSGGQKTRLQLAKLLLQEPDLLVLDEPTNHLDIDTVEWLETYLQSYPCALLVVSHDRYFLDRATAITYELDRGRTLRFPASYSEFAQWKEEERERQLEAFDEQQALIARMQDFINRNLVRATTTKRAQSRRKALAKIERLESPVERKTAHLNFPVGVTSGREVLTVKDLSIVRGERTLFPPLTAQIRRGDRVALLGPNGVGKTSLLHALLEQLPHTGSIRIGTHVSIAYFAQELQGFDGDQTVLEALWSAYPRLSETEVRTRLGHVLFHGDAVYKPCSVLSGGERSRLALARLALTEANLLLLDEPTNHLDLPSREMLETALDDFEGTLLFVSHDRYFINRLATRIMALAPDGVTQMDGDYDDWLAAMRAQAERERDNRVSGRERSVNQTDWELRKRQRAETQRRRDRLQKVEAEIASAEGAKASLESQLTHNDTYLDIALAERLQRQFAEIDECLLTLYTEWEALSEAVETDEADENA